MLVLRWYITHNEPHQRDHHHDQGEDQRHHGPAAFGAGVHVQEVHHVDDDLGDRKRHDRSAAVGLVAPIAPVMTSQNGIAVRMTDRPKPIR